MPVKAEKGSAGKDQHNIIWITCEDISPYIECYGEDLVKTPNIDQLADEGVKFNKAFTAAGVCAPSRSAIITGMYPMSIGTMHMRTLKTPVSIPMENIPFYSRITSYNVCYTKLLRDHYRGRLDEFHNVDGVLALTHKSGCGLDHPLDGIRSLRITSYNVCYTKLLRSGPAATRSCC